MFLECNMAKKQVYTRLEEDTLQRIDTLISKKQFDNRASFLRYAANDTLRRLEQRILA